MSAYFYRVKTVIRHINMYLRVYAHVRSVATLLILVVVAGGPSSKVWAEGLGINCDYTGSIYINPPTSIIRVKPNAAIGDPIGSWMTISAPEVWSCALLPAYQSRDVRAGILVFSPYNPLLTTNIDGGNYKVFRTGDTNPGLGIAVRFRAIGAGFSSDWTQLEGFGLVDGTVSAPLIGPIPYNDGIKFPLGMEMQIHYVKASEELRSGGVRIFDFAYLYHRRSIDGVPDNSGARYRIVQVPANSIDIQIMTQTCTTPDVVVNLPEVNSRQFTGIGTVKALKAFNLNFNHCPGGLDGINYKFGATTSILDSANGVVALDANSTAEGVGVLLRSQSDAAIELDKEYTMSGYDTSSTQNYTVPMQAGIYQIENTVTPGSVKGEFTFTLIYK
ncbi:fimbrial protein [Yersinia pestis]|uniref:fimbrial protein n=1 Tax=Yersinia pestis TaxID=632 RepID=UPI000627B25D|nr:fimbrial protein [Yersinia pestis]KKM56255.1 fimbrial protein [Yersinia pestis]